MATVYLAHDLRHERHMAIRVLHPDLAAALGGERFLSEIKTTARLPHPHILPLRLAVNRTVGYDVTSDGSRFPLVEPVERPGGLPNVVITNWVEELRRKVPR